MDVLKAVRQNHTVWSVVYNLSTGQVRLVVGMDYDDVHAFQLPKRTGK